MNTVMDKRYSPDVAVGVEYLLSNPYEPTTEKSQQLPRQPRIAVEPLQHNNLLLVDDFGISRKDPRFVRARRGFVELIQGQAKSKGAFGRLAMQETYDGVVVEGCGDTAVVIYDVGEDRVEQTYDQSQFVDGCLPAEGTRLRVQVEVFELPADESEDFDDEELELTDEAIARGPERLTEPTEF